MGLFAIPIAKIRGAKVFATASTANQDFLKQLGADVAIDYKTQQFEEIAKDVDVVVDGVGGETLARSYPIVKKGGILVSLVGRVDQAQLDKYGIRGASLEAEPDSDQLAQIGRLIDEKKIKVVVSQTFPLADAAKAQAQADTGHARGKIVLKGTRRAEVTEGRTIETAESTKNMLTASFPRRVFGSADHSGADRTLDRAGAAQE